MLRRRLYAIAVAISLPALVACSAMWSPRSSSGASAQAAQLQWREFRDKGGTFAIQFPGEPIVKSEDLSSGGFTTTKYQVSVTHEKCSFMVASFEVPDSGHSIEQTRWVIETSVTQAAESGNAKVVSKRSFNVNGSPAFELAGESFDGKQLLTIRRIAVARRAYMFVVMRDRDALPDSDVSRFMDSFVLLKPN